MLRDTMKVIYYVFSALVILLSSSCCSDMRQLNEPKRLSKVRGWEDLRHGDTIIDGIFLLNKGESTDNGKTGIRLVETYAGKCELFNEPEYPKAKLQFYRVSDQAILCESVFDRGGMRLAPPMTRLISNVNEKCAHCSFAASITYSVFGLRWLIIPACLSTFIAHQIILSKYVLPLPHEAQTPMLLKLLLWWRNLSLFLVLLSSVASPVRRSDCHSTITKWAEDLF